MNKNVRFQGEPAPDYDEPQPDYDQNDDEPEPDYDDPQPVSAKAVIPQIAARPTGALRHMSRSADTEHDLSVMENLNEVSILKVLEERFKHDVIQTYIGDVLIVINPYKALDLYGERYHEMYKFVNQRADLEPHIYWTVDHAYRRMTDSATNQVILISGESGAGKTESTKLVVKHLTHICQSTMSDLHERIVKVNPLLEAFGNAQTVMNHNSSRFGKFVELVFNGNGQMKGARIHDYLLEKSRVVHLGPQERNFHVFYYMFAGMPEETLRYYYLEDPMAHRILKSDHNQKGVFYGEDDRERCKEMFTQMEKIMEKVKFSKDDIAIVYTCLAAVLFITNVEFQPEDDDDGVVIIDDYPVNIVADLLAIDVEKLTTSLVSKTDMVHGEEIIALKTMEQAIDGRDAVAKSLYSRLFGWIVRQVNTNLMDTSQGSLSASNTIGILDLSGFENFSDNSFEQLCINVANEKLQYFFNTFIFATEQAIYAEEGIDWSQIEFRNNEDILRLFLGDEGVGQTGQKKMSFQKEPDMFTIVDDESKSPRSSDATLVLNWRRNVGKHPNFQAVEGDELAFVITHFADKVLYNASNFLEKNRDRLGNNLMSVLQKSENGFITDLFKAELTDTGVLSRTKSKIRGSTRMAFGRSMKKRGGGSVSGDTVRRLKNRGKHQMPGMGVQMKVQTTVSQHFRKSLEELMRKMNNAQPLFVRCIKPNKYQEPDKWTDKLVQRQLQYSGVLQIAKIARLGYPVRMAFSNFYKRFTLIFPQRTGVPSGDACGKALQAVGFRTEEFAIGRTKVFMKEDVADRLRLAVLERAALTAQRAVRGFVARKQYEARKEEEARRQREIEEERLIKQREKEQEQARKRAEEEAKRRAEEAKKKKKPAPVVPVVVETVNELPNAQPQRPPSDDLSVIAENPEDEEPTPPLPERQDDPGDEVTPYNEGGMEDQQFDDNLFVDDMSNSESDEEMEDMNWDIAQLVPVDRVSPSETFDSFVKAMRVLFYIFLFIVIIVSGSVSIVSLLWLVQLTITDRDLGTNRNQTEVAATKEIMKEQQIYYLSQLMWIILIPHCWSFITSVMKTVFGHMVWPSARIFFVVLTIETLHSLGLVTLVFGVLPKVPPLYAVGLLTCVASVPAFLQIILPRTHQIKTSTVLVKWTLSLLALLVQLGAIVYIYIVYMVIEGHKDDPRMKNLYWQLPVSLILMSLKWWENYVPRGKKRGGSPDPNQMSVSARLFRFKKQLHQYRTKLNTVMSLWNFFFCNAALWVLMMIEGDTVIFNTVTPYRSYAVDANSTDTDDSTSGFPRIDYYVFLTQVISSWICYYFSALACKLLMQRVSFCAPLTLAFPVAAAIIQVLCSYPNCLDSVLGCSGDMLVCHVFGDQCNKPLYTAIGIVFWLSLVWISNHVWYPRSERLAKTEKLFVTRLFTGPLVVQSMLLNRRFDDAEVKVSITGQHDMSDTFTLATTATGVPILPDEKKKRSSTTPIIYACATMWHENKLEMIQLLKSVFRMDADQSARRLAREVFNHNDPDYYDFEAHVFFDDAMELDDDEERVVNQFVRLLVTCMDEAASSVLESEVAMPQPVLMPTPYGGRLTWTLPGRTLFVAHLKDKSKIRHLKRWSQVMYMYYLLGYKLFGEKEGEMMQKLQKSAQKGRVGADHVGKSSIFGAMEEDLLNQAENTFLLALDGDVDFKPEAVRLLVDRMRKNYKTGAACGRIHPIGTGPMVWYQVFEYAVGHWFQKSTEHVLGCVLCSPGCFSLFRGSALLDDNVMKRYTTRPTAAVEFLQYDQGEDRWLCTLLLQQGYRVDYTAASDALTYAPEGFNEFFNQRRRWTPSTMANIIDLLSSAGNTVRMNDNISWFYMFYQGGLMGATVLGPATVILAIATAFETVLKIEKWEGYLMSLMPVVFQLIISFTTKKNTQLLVCAFLSTFYACVMTVVAVGIMKGLVSDGFLDPSLIFLTVMSGSFILAGIMHPYEFTCLLYGIIYYLCIPSGYLVLIIFAFSNLQDISWGTRDVPKKKTKAQLEEEKKKDEEKLKKKKRGWFSFLNIDSLLKEVRETMTSIFSEKKEDSVQAAMLKTLRYIRKDMKKINRRLAGDSGRADSDSDSESENEAKKPAVVQPAIEEPEPPQEVAIPEPDMDEHHRELYEEDTDNPAWINKWEGEKCIDYLDISEAQFWRQLIKKYLKPIKKDAKFEKKVLNELIELRNNVSFAYWLINGLWILFNFMIQSTKGLDEATIFGQKTQPLGFIFMILFMIALFLQFIGMLMHRWGTLLQLIAITELTSPFQKKHTMQPGDSPMQKGLSVKQAVKVMTELQKGRSMFDAPEEPPVDYSDEEEDEMMPSTPLTPGGAIGGDRRPANGDVGVKRRLRSLTDDALKQTIRDRVIERKKIDMDLQFREQTYTEVGENVSDDETFKRPGGYDWQHRFTQNTISRALTRRAHRPRVDQEPEERGRQHGHFRKHGHEKKHKKDHHRRDRDRSDSRGRSEERSHHRHRHHRRQTRRTDIGPNTHVIRGGELETHLIRRLDRWKQHGGHPGVEEVSHF